MSHQHAPDPGGNRSVEFRMQQLYSTRKCRYVPESRTWDRTACYFCRKITSITQQMSKPIL